MYPHGETFGRGELWDGAGKGAAVRGKGGVQGMHGGGVVGGTMLTDCVTEEKKDKEWKSIHSTLTDSESGSR
jgi:hypothetical protein